MKPPQPLNPAPFLTLLTPTFNRPAGLTANLASVKVQTAAADVEQIVLPDHVGYGVADGLYGRLPSIAPAVRGQYVNLLCDDDVLAGEGAVAGLKAFAQAQGYPPLIIAPVQKGPLRLPLCDPQGEPISGHVDLTSYIVRADIWQRFVYAYGNHYAGDFDHAHAMWQAGIPAVPYPVLWAVGAQSNGRPEA